MGLGTLAALPIVAFYHQPSPARDFIKDLGFVDKIGVCDPKYAHMFSCIGIEQKVMYSRKNPRDGWLLIIKYIDGWLPKASYARKYYPGLPEKPWYADWTPQETGYITNWSVYARTEAELMRALTKKFLGIF